MSKLKIDACYPEKYCFVPDNCLKLVAFIFTIFICNLQIFSANAEQFVQNEEIVEESSPLKVTIHNHSYKLDVLIVRKRGDEKLPIALITHGSNDHPMDMSVKSLDALQSWAHDFAHRGWLSVAILRRGYGNSEGFVNDPNSISCVSPNLGEFFNTDADDLQAVIDVIAARPDADGSRIIVVGHSAGGGAAMALAARPESHIAGVINVAGGIGSRSGPFQPNVGCSTIYQELVWTFASFGTKVHVPTLWIYSENDGWFRPGLVNSMYEVFLRSVGSLDATKSKLIIMSNFKEDGHYMFSDYDGKEKIIPEIDKFLREHNLPTWKEDEFINKVRQFPAPLREPLMYYLRTQSSEMAFAASSSGLWRIRRGSNTTSEAQNDVLDDCKKLSHSDCKLFAKGFQLILPRDEDHQLPAH